MNVFDDINRENKLKSIMRYSMVEQMYYRSSLWQHTHRVAWIIKELEKEIHTFLPGCDFEKAYTLAFVHDDAEMITGDIQLGHKLQMSQEQLEKLDQEEKSAAQELAGRYDSFVNGFSYLELLLEPIDKKTLESQLVSYADKLDAYCESLHEVLAGNLVALRALLSYQRILGTFDKKFPLLKPFLDNKNGHPLCDIELRVNEDQMKIASYDKFGKTHTKESVDFETDFASYNQWRKMVIKNLEQEEGYEWLTSQN